MASRSKFISFRLLKASHEELEKRAAKLGFSAGELAREIVLGHLANQEAERRGVGDLHDQMQKLRADLARATEALLTVMGGTQESAGRAQAWVRKNLNG